MRRTVLFTAAALVGGAVYVGCTQDFDQFEPKGTTFTSSSGAGGAAGAAGVGGAGGTMASVGPFSSSASSSASTGGGCMTAADCGTDTNCRFYSCNSGTCNQTNSADNTSIPPAGQVPGDCKMLLCDGMGGEKTVADSQDLPTDEPNDCTTEECNVDMPVHTPVAAGMPCATGVCDGMGACVSCMDGIQNGTETGVDCGGTCKSCDGTAC